MSEFSRLSAKYLTPRVYEITLFFVVGIMNTGVDFTVLNLLILLTHHDTSWWLIIFNCLSFLSAVINSYIFNGRFTFRHRGSSGSSLFLRFVAVNIGGLAINSVVVWLMVPLLGGRFSPLIAVNISKAVAVLFSLMWNYFAIRQWVFTSSRVPDSANPLLTEPMPVHSESLYNLHPVGSLSEENYD